MQIRPDVKYCLLAWAVAITSLIIPYPEASKINFVMKIIIHPAAWIVCVAMVWVSEKGKPTQALGWALLSAPLAFFNVAAFVIFTTSFRF